MMKSTSGFKSKELVRFAEVMLKKRPKNNVNGIFIHVCLLKRMEMACRAHPEPSSSGTAACLHSNLCDGPA